MASPLWNLGRQHGAETLCPIVVCHADQWLRRMRLPVHTLTTLMKMNAGEELVLFEFDAPALLAGGHARVCRARIERRRDGQCRFDALWTRGAGNTRGRATIYAVGEFTTVGPRLLSWEARSGEAMERFRRILRLGACLSRTARPVHCSTDVRGGLS